MTRQNTLLEDGLYQLGNHPDGNAAAPEYGLRLDGILTGNADDTVTFDFEHPDSDVKLELSGSQIHIYGIAFGGIDIGEIYDPDNSGLWEIDVTYNHVQGLTRGLIVDDDLIVDQANAGSNTGTIKQLFGEEKTFDLNDYAGNHPISFQLGNEINDQGHRGFSGISGWGWLNHSNFEGYAPASDWLFIVNPEPLSIDKNNPPDAVDDFATTTAGHKVGIRVLDNDSDPDGDVFNLKYFTQASNGVVKLS
ncbi:MAG: Ig-like domain-containing protein [Xenococcus sp. (in: cyanobacteria)]